MENKKSQGKKSSGIIATKKSDPQHDDGDGTAGEETPEFMPTPFGTKLVAVKKKEKGTVDIFKRPASPTPLPAKRRKVLSEDKFAEALEKIIQRECFPELEKLKAQNAYLDAVANNDVQMMRELHTKYAGGRTPSVIGANETPSTFETPSCSGMSSLRKDAEADGCTPSIHLDKGPTPSSSAVDIDNQSVKSESSTISKREPHEMTLNEFLNTYTSEDDKSFQDLIDEGIRKHQLKYAWLYQQENVRNDQVKQALALPSAEEQHSLEYQRPSEVGTWTYTNKNAVMYIPDGVPYTNEEIADLSKKKVEVDFGNTRFAKSLFKTDSKDTSSSQTAGKAMNLIGGITEGKIGLDGKEVNSKDETPSVNGFKLVRTPSPTPGSMEESPFLTWGEIEGTPFRLDAGDTPVVSHVGAPYRMIATSHREKLALELAEKASQRHRDRKQKTIDIAKSYLTTPSPRPKTSQERMNLMSPAAQRLTKSLVKKEIGTPRTPR